MKEYLKPEITVLSFVSKEALSSSLDGLNLIAVPNGELAEDGLTSYEITSIDA